MSSVQIKLSEPSRPSAQAPEFPAPGQRGDWVLSEKWVREMGDLKQLAMGMLGASARCLANSEDCDGGDLGGERACGIHAFRWGVEDRLVAAFSAFEEVCKANRHQEGRPWAALPFPLRQVISEFVNSLMVAGAAAEMFAEAKGEMIGEIPRPQAFDMLADQIWSRFRVLPRELMRAQVSEEAQP